MTVLFAVLMRAIVVFDPSETYATFLTVLIAIPVGLVTPEPASDIVIGAACRFWVLITEMVSLPLLATYTNCPFGVIATPIGALPTGIVFSTVLLPVLITLTLLLPLLVTKMV